MKKFMALLMAMVMVFMLAACGSGGSPEAVVENFMKEFKAGNLDNLKSYVTSDASSEIEALTGMLDIDNLMEMTDLEDMPGITEEYIKEKGIKLIKAIMSNVDYKVGGTELTDNEATVRVEINLPDFAAMDETAIMSILGMSSEADMMNIMAEAMGVAPEEVITKAMEMSQNPEYEAEVALKTVDIIFERIIDYFEGGASELATTVEEGAFSLKVEDGKWLIFDIE